MTDLIKKLHGEIKVDPQDFVVREITLDNKTLNEHYSILEKIMDMVPKNFNEHLYCTLIKRNYTTQRAIQTIASKLRISRTRFGYAGIKDKRAITAQRISIWNVKIADVKRILAKDIALKNFSYSSERISLGDLSGNSFRIKIVNIGEDREEQDKIMKEVETLAKKGVPNYFGIQRFGEQREINFDVGKAIMGGRFEDAVKIILTFPGDANPEASMARKFALENWGKWTSILKVWPKSLGIEASILNFLVQNSQNFRGAIRTVPTNLRKMFIHAVQSKIFNESLKEIVQSRTTLPNELPLVGAMTQFSGEVGKIFEAVMKKLKVAKESFTIKEMPELSENGSIRDSIMPIHDFRYSIQNEGTTVEFSLNKGSYATNFLDFFVDNKF